MGTRQNRRYRVTISISEEAHTRLQQYPGVKSAWVERMILGSPIPEKNPEQAEVQDLQRRMTVLETAVATLRTKDHPVEDHADASSAEEQNLPLPPGGRGAGGRRRAASPAFQNRVVELHRAGHSVTEIMRQLRTGHGTVRKILAAHGFE